MATILRGNDNFDSSNVATDTELQAGLPNSDQLVKAWVQYQTEPSFQIVNAYNVSSITNNSTGHTTLNFASSMPNAEYVAVGTNGNGEYITFISESSRTATSVQMRTYYPDANAYVVNADINVAIMGN